MNVDTGRIYKTAEEIQAAKDRGEQLVQISPGAHGHVSERQREMRAAPSAPSGRKFERPKDRQYHERLQQKQREYCEQMNQPILG